MITYKTAQEQLISNYIIVSDGSYSLDWNTYDNLRCEINIQHTTDYLSVIVSLDYLTLTLYKGEYEGFFLNTIKPIDILTHLLSLVESKFFGGIQLIIKEIEILESYVIDSDEQLTDIARKISLLDYAIIGNIYYVLDNTLPEKKYILINVYPSSKNFDKNLSIGRYATIILYLVDSTASNIYFYSYAVEIDKSYEWWENLKFDNIFLLLLQSYSAKPDCISEINMIARKFKITRALKEN